MARTKISIIAAIGKNRELGKDNKLLWHIPEDLKRFKKLTSGHAVIMGRKTYESIGKPLPNRTNIIITRDIKKFEIRNSKFEINKNFFVCSLFDKAIKIARSVEKKEIFVIGGGQIFELALPYADKLYLTVVEDAFEADTFFPDYSEFDKIVYKESKEPDRYKFTFLDLER